MSTDSDLMLCLSLFFPRIIQYQSPLQCQLWHIKAEENEGDISFLQHFKLKSASRDLAMTGQHNPSTNYCLQTIFAILILHTAAISCAPESIACETCNHRSSSCDVVVQLHEGSSFLRIEIIPSVYPQYNDQVRTFIFLYCILYIMLSFLNIYIQEVDRCTAPNLTEAVCPIFEEYSRLSVTLENLPQNDSLHTNLSLLVLVTRRVLIDFCKFKVSYYAWTSPTIIITPNKD